MKHFLEAQAARTHFFNILAPGIFDEMGLHPTKLEKMARSAVILRISMAKRHVAAGINSLSTTNEKRTIPAQRNLLKRKRPQPEHKAPKRYIEVGINDSTGYKLPISLSTAAADMPRRSGFPGWMRWSPEDGEGGLRRVLLPRPLVRRKATIKSTRMTWYSPLVKPE